MTIFHQIRSKSISRGHNFCLFILICAFGFSQGKNSGGDKSYFNLAYVDAIIKYKKELKKNPDSWEVYQNLVNAHYFNADLANACGAYSELHQRKKDLDAEIYFRYSHALKSVKKYDEAFQILKTRIPFKIEALTMVQHTKWFVFNGTSTISKHVSPKCTTD